MLRAHGGGDEVPSPPLLQPDSTMSDERINFSRATRRVIAGRSGFQCAFPNCNRLTIGPGLKDDQVEDTGFAAHIYSAAKRGPRGQGELSEAELKSAANGFWTCGAHESLIDQNSGNRYPASTLLSWKALHEHRVAHDHSGRGITLGFIRRMRILRSALFADSSEIELAKTTFLVGRNGTGKTALCQWLTTIDSPRHLGRWRAQKEPLEFDIEFDAPHTRSLKVTIDNVVPIISVDNRSVVYNHVPFGTALLGYERDHGFKDTLERISRALFTDPVSVQSIAGFIDANSIFLNRARFVEEDDDDGERVTNLYCTLKDGHERAFDTLSTSEQARTLLDFAIAQIRSISQFSPALLAIEFDGLHLSWESFEPYLQLFAQPRSDFQTLVTTHTLPDDVARLGWQIFELDKSGREKATIRAIS
jgi:energy-coupling factor transporter ATP-binding protein EcfA2